MESFWNPANHRVMVVNKIKGRLHKRLRKNLVCRIKNGICKPIKTRAAVLQDDWSYDDIHKYECIIGNRSV